MWEFQCITWRLRYYVKRKTLLFRKLNEQSGDASHSSEDDYCGKQLDGITAIASICIANITKLDRDAELTAIGYCRQKCAWIYIFHFFSAITSNNFLATYTELTVILVTTSQVVTHAIEFCWSYLDAQQLSCKRLHWITLMEVDILVPELPGCRCISDL